MSEWTVPDEAVEAALSGWPYSGGMRALLEAAAPFIRADLEEERDSIDSLYGALREDYDRVTAEVRRLRVIPEFSSLSSRERTIFDSLVAVSRERDDARAEVERLRRRLRSEIGEPSPSPEVW